MKLQLLSPSTLPGNYAFAVPFPSLSALQFATRGEGFNSSFVAERQAGKYDYD